MKKRNLWPSSATNFVTAAGVVITNAKANQKKLAEEATTITVKSLNDLDARVLEAKTKYIGQDKKKEQRDNTASVKISQDAALAGLGSVKNTIETKIKDKAQRQELLVTLGFNTYFAKANKKNQQALTSLLNHFSTNLTAAIRTQLEAAGVSKKRIDDLLLAVSGFDNANTNQETTKGTTLRLTETATDFLNELYTDIMTICKAGQRVFKNDPALKALFVLSKIIANLGEKKAPKAKKDAPVK